ncbi:unnamed protein product [Schistosoma mattheei]|uniref:Uncharacterized protein n=1 Tax=Schistosoma mattheei TaxID=31246 RepID=A0A3P8G6Z5_9TREM|nr:unnamed protein product [Schistosoma mattheei]
MNRPTPLDLLVIEAAHADNPLAGTPSTIKKSGCSPDKPKSGGQ